MSSRPKKKRYSLEEVEDMLMNDPDSGDSDLDLGEDFAALDIESNRDEESENDNNNNVMIWKRSYGYQIFYYICQICCLRLGLRSSGFTHD